MVGGQPHAMRETEAINRAGPTLAGKLVIIDPGHGGPDRGVGPGTSSTRRELVYDLASRIEGRLTATGASAFLTRGPDGAPRVRARRTGPASPTPPAPTCCCPCTSNRHANTAASGRRHLLLRQRRVRPLLHGRRAARRPGAARDLRPHRPGRLPGARQELGPAAPHPDAGRPGRGGLPDQPGRRRCGWPTPPSGTSLAEAVAAAVQRLYLPPEDDAHDRRAADPGVAARVTCSSRLLRRSSAAAGSAPAGTPAPGSSSPSSRSSATSTSSRQDSALRRSSRSRGKQVVRAHRLEAHGEQEVGRHARSRRAAGLVAASGRTPRSRAPRAG